MSARPSRNGSTTSGIRIVRAEKRGTGARIFDARDRRRRRIGIERHAEIGRRLGGIRDRRQHERARQPHFRLARRRDDRARDVFARRQHAEAHLRRERAHVAARDLLGFDVDQRVAVLGIGDLQRHLGLAEQRLDRRRVISIIADTVSLSITVVGRGRGNSPATGGCGTSIKSDTLMPLGPLLRRALIE